MKTYPIGRGASERKTRGEKCSSFGENKRTDGIL